MMPLAQAHLFAIVLWICNKTLQFLIYSQSTPITSSGQQANIVVIIALEQSPKVLLSLTWEKFVVCWGFLESLQTVGKIIYKWTDSLRVFWQTDIPVKLFLVIQVETSKISVASHAFLNSFGDPCHIWRILFRWGRACLLYCCSLFQWDQCP